MTPFKSITNKNIDKKLVKFLMKQK